MSSSVQVASLVQRSLPILKWAGGYEREWLLPDVFAGVALWAVMVPEGMAYASIVGVPPIMGLYSIVPGLLVYALLGTSRQLVASHSHRFVFRADRGRSRSSGHRGVQHAYLHPRCLDRRFFPFLASCGWAGWPHSFPRR